MDFTLLLAPEGDAGGGSAPAAASAAAAPSAPASTPAPAAAPASTPAAPAAPAAPSAPKPADAPRAGARETTKRQSVSPSDEMRLNKAEIAAKAKKAAELAANPAAPVVKRPVGRPRNPPTIKIGDKVYTEAEIQALELKANTPAPGLAPEPAAPAAEAPIAPIADKGAVTQTPEEQIAARKKVEEIYVARHIAESELPDLTAEDLDVMYGGGEAAAAKFNEVRKRDGALIAKKIAAEMTDLLNPVFQQFEQEMTPLVRREQQIVEYQVRQEFATAYPDMAPHAKDCEYVARELIRLYPAQVDAMSREKFLKEVNDQTEQLLNQRVSSLGFKNWRDVPKPGAPAAPVPPVVAAAIAPAAAPAVPATPPMPAVRPPSGGFLPAAGGGAVETPSAASRDTNWQKTQARALQ